MPARPEQPEPFLRGSAFASGAEPWGEPVPYPRAQPGPLSARLPADTLGAAALPVGVRFEMVGDARALVVDYETRTSDMGYRGDGAGRRFALWRGGALVDEQPARLGRNRVTLSLGSGTSAEPARLYLPEGMKPLVHRLVAIEGSLSPAPPEPRWLCYGDSIAEGWIASAPALAWPAIVGREQRLDVVNLGYAGAARGEIVSGQQIAELPADLIAISYGTNCWTRTPHTVDAFGEGLRSFFEVVRRGHSQTPIVAVSPLLRPDAEKTPNELATTLAQLRERFEAVVRERTRSDARLALIEGADLVRADQLPDGIHPGDAGHRALADALGPVLRAQLD